MNNKQKGIGCIILAMLSAFTYGIYTVSTVGQLKYIEPHRWVLTGLFGIMWVYLAVQYLTKSHED